MDLLNEGLACIYDDKVEKYNLFTSDLKRYLGNEEEFITKTKMVICRTDIWIELLKKGKLFNVTKFNRVIYISLQDYFFLFIISFYLKDY